MRINTKQLSVCKKLKKGSHDTLETDQYCIPVFIASSFSGTFFEREENLAPKKIGDKTVRSGTVTFISYKGEYLALTCKHVVDALEGRKKLWRQEQGNRGDGLYPDFDGIDFFTPIDKTHHHFNYTFKVVEKDRNGDQPDLAIARVPLSFITRLKRKPIIFSGKKKLPITGIASGYPEEQRVIVKGQEINLFCPKFVTCVASLQITSNGNLYLNDSVDHHNDIDVLSGMSGGPIIWSDQSRFGLAGLIKEGGDIQPKPDGLTIDNSVFILGERITPKLLDNWLKSIPKLETLPNKTKFLVVPKSMRKSCIS